MVFSLGDWHKLYLDKLEKLFLERSDLREKYEIENSNRRRLYLPYWEGIKRREILSNPDILLVNKEDDTFDYIFEVEYNINYKKLVGIAFLTDMAVGRMRIKKRKPKLILITRKKFPNYEFIRREVEDYVRNSECELFTADTFDISVIR